MNTAEVAIEHILTGILALCAFALPLLSDKTIIEKLFRQKAALVAVLGMAYLFGVAFDRLADTILSPIEDYLRLFLANHFLEKNHPPYKRDPFPQDVLEFSLRGEAGGRVEWMDSLRSRIRTSRGLSVLGIQAAMGIAIFLRPTSGSFLGWKLWPHFEVAVNLFLMVLSVVALSISSGKKRWYEKFKSYKTDELYVDESERKNRMKIAKRRMLICSSLYILVLVNSAMTTVFLAPLPDSWPARGVILICGGVVMALPVWVWYRITETYMKFIYLKLPDLLDEGKARPIRRVHG